MRKQAIITGASKGIGLGLVQQLLDEGYAVLGTSRDGTSTFRHEQMKMIALDLSINRSVNKAINHILDHHSKIDLLINNAGIGPDLGIDHPDWKSFTDTFDVNVKGTVFFTESLLSRLADDAKIINISSKMGSLNHCKGTNSIAYRMSKSALNMYSKILTNRLQNGIKVANLHPGWVRTMIHPSNIDNATLSPEESASSICKFINSDFKHGIYWDAEANVELEW